MNSRITPSKAFAVDFRPLPEAEVEMPNSKLHRGLDHCDHSGTGSGNFAGHVAVATGEVADAGTLATVASVTPAASGQ